MAYNLRESLGVIPFLHTFDCMFEFIKREEGYVVQGDPL